MLGGAFRQDRRRRPLHPPAACRRLPGRAAPGHGTKTAVVPQVFVLAPVGEYGHRLVLDKIPETRPTCYWRWINKRELRQIPVDDAAGDKADRDCVRRRCRVAARGGGKGGGRPVVDRLVTITIDPGHGGEDLGAGRCRGTYEKNVTMAVARRLKAKIAEPNMRAVPTRDSDFFVPLHMRAQKARRLQSDFCLIHA